MEALIQLRDAAKIAGNDPAKIGKIVSALRDDYGILTYSNCNLVTHLWDVQMYAGNDLSYHGKSASLGEAISQALTERLNEM